MKCKLIMQFSPLYLLIVSFNTVYFFSLRAYCKRALVSFIKLIILLLIYLLPQSVLSNTTNINANLNYGTSLEDIKNQCNANDIDYTKAFSFIKKLQVAIKDNNRELVANLINYPLSVYDFHNSNKHLNYQIKSREMLLSKYDLIFDKNTKQAILKQNPYDIFCNYRGAMIVGGIWFSGRPLSIFEIHTPL